jgi:maltose O-acetyltransferase
MGRLFQAGQACHAAYLESTARCGFKKIGENVVLSGCGFGNRERINLGNHIYLGPGGSFQGLGGITIEDYNIFGPEVVILSSLHNFNWETSTMVPYDEVELLKPVVIRRACWVGMRTIILPGVELGEGCVVGAGSVLTKSWPAGAILGGAPANAIGQRDMNHFQKCCNEGRFYMRLKKLHGLSKIEKWVK